MGFLMLSDNSDEPFLTFYKNDRRTLLGVFPEGSEVLSSGIKVLAPSSAFGWSLVPFPTWMSPSTFHVPHSRYELGSKATHTYVDDDGR